MFVCWSPTGLSYCVLDLVEVRGSGLTPAQGHHALPGGGPPLPAERQTAAPTSLLLLAAAAAASAGGGGSGLWRSGVGAAVGQERCDSSWALHSKARRVRGVPAAPPGDAGY